ncbi:MAG: hypothetical protein OET63_21350 [Desulfobacterales bacterium]|nr:hypothetical protein [Desulfobacterales bacterium]
MIRPCVVFDRSGSRCWRTAWTAAAMIAAFRVLPRMGTAVRHTAAELGKRPNLHRLLLVLSDGIYSVEWCGEVGKKNQHQGCHQQADEAGSPPGAGDA